MLDYSNPTDDDALNAVFRALAHPVRRAILRQTADTERSITELAAPFDMTLEAVSQHVRVLERTGLLNRTRHGRVHHCRMDPRPLKDATVTLQMLGQMWSGRLDLLDQVLESPEGET